MNVSSLSGGFSYMNGHVLTMKKIVLFSFFLLGIQQSTNCVSLASSFKKLAPSFFKSKELSAPRIALITINDDMNFYQVAQHLIAVAKNRAFDGAILVVNNYDGSLGAFSVIHDLIKKVSEKKPIVCLVGQGALSCGYVIASATNYIFAHTLSDLGALGVIRQVKRYKQAKVKEDSLEADMHVELLFSGAFKSETHVFAKDLTDEQRRSLQAELDFSYAAMLDMVAKNRNLKRENYKEWAEGQVFIAPHALKLGLIDQIGTIFDAEEKIRELVVKKNSQATYGSGVTVVTL